ncbi:MAG: hypothetical protein GXO82_09220, partial [Chlorobi bacterium]|nr:hypothetical protein [Chlorobiota bacterium]
MRKRFILLVLFLAPAAAWSQLEHVPASNLVYDFLNHMQVRGYLPDYNRAFIPATRREVVGWLHEVNQHAKELSESERELALRFSQEFIDEADRRQSRTVFLSDKDPWSKRFSDILSDKEKFLYVWRDPSDTATTFFMEGLASLDARSAIIDGEGKHVSLGQIGGRFRGTIRGIVGYGLQSTNGTTFGDRDFALTDPVLRQNTAFTDFNSDYFDFTEAYVSVDFDWGRLSLGKERFLMGSGLQDKLYISSNAPTFDAIRFEARFKTFRYVFIHS